jgi:hypothetical protein
MHEIKSFRIFQTAKVIAVLYAISFAIMAAIELIVFATLGHGRRPPIGAIVVVPIVGGIFSFLFTAFFCWLYNQVAARIGGVAFELTPRSED